MAEYTVSEDGQIGVTWYMRHGATFIKNYQWKTGDPSEPVDLTGWTARCQIRTKLGGEVLLSLTSPAGGIEVDDQGNIAIEITAAQTMDMYPAKKGVFDLELEAPGGFVRNLVGGTVLLAPNVTVE